MSCSQQLDLLEFCHSCMCQTQGCAPRAAILIAELQIGKVNARPYAGRRFLTTEVRVLVAFEKEV